MDASFWHEAWREGRIGFHREDVHPRLTQFWGALGVTSEEAVLVPLCGKTRDMLWLRQRGHPVTGVELSERALQQFVTENDLALARTSQGFEGDGYRLLAGDWFTVGLDGEWTAFYDRAALVAMPPDRRAAYVERLLERVSNNARGLLISLEYDNAEMSGPPFGVSARELRTLFADQAVVEELHRDDVLEQEPRFREKGLSRLQEVVWAIHVG